ncbi:hypothetical protein Ocin01_15418 [Orchesella cincta]|uniref:Integrase catalytic domain-containing protein n=1 Tax=Orchesella cincta TaxID=48709 RepID=A0A1D2ME99_ORCCI|nr:hypothetical protein Ocin01_15418 [Orchesella cincta]
MYHTYTKRKAILVERYNKVLRARLYAIMFHTHSKVWYSHLKSVLESYNATPSSRYKIAPNDINKDNQFEILKEVYKEMAAAKKSQKPSKLQPGMSVRVSREKFLFEKAATYNWTTEIFTISKVEETVPWTYRLVDLKGEEILGSFYKEQLLRVHPASQQDD